MSFARCSRSASGGDAREAMTVGCKPTKMGKGYGRVRDRDIFCFQEMGYGFGVSSEGQKSTRDCALASDLVKAVVNCQTSKTRAQKTFRTNC